MKPKSEYNHIIWGFFILIMGTLSVIFSDKPSEDELDFFQKVHNSPEYWIGIIVVIVFNILVGIYTANKHKKG
jgi:ABC-type antimicrobial peptide transport system permease subunit